MRAFTRASVAAAGPPRPQVTAPDYALRIPLHVQVALAAGLLSGLAGLVVIFSAPGLLAYLLLAVGVGTVVLALLLSVVTSRRLRARARRQMLAAIAWRGDERVLDVGCGNGFLLLEAAKHLTTGTATGIDVWKTEAGGQTAGVVWRNAQLEGVVDRIEIQQADARRMPFADNTFDVIVSSLMLHHAGSATDRRAVLQEMVRVAKPGGRILLYDVLPVILDAASHLRANGVSQIRRSGMVVPVLSAIP